MKDTPMVSIIIPVYNGGNFLREAIDSALAQTYSSLEIIVVNDGSNDGGETDRIAVSYGDRIRYYSKVNGGVASALNMGIKHMKGEYFSWLSHDDLYLPEKIESDMEILFSSEDRTIPVHGGWENFNKSLGLKDVRLPSKTKYDQKYYESGILSVIMGLIDGCSVLIHRSYFEKYGLFDEKLLTTQDYAKWFEMFRDKKILFVNRVLVRSRIHDFQTSRTNMDVNNNIKELHLRFAKEIDEIDARTTGMDYYQFLCVVMTRFENLGILDAVRIIEEKLLSISEPAYGSESRNNLREYLTEFGNDIYLCCMGKRGKALVRALLLRGIRISGFTDSDENICNQKFWGIPGSNISDIPKDSLVIVTLDHGDELCISLCEKGYEHVILYNEIEQLVGETIIDKKVLDVSRTT